MTARFASILPGIVIACVFSLLLNASDLRSWSRGTLNVAELGASLGSADEVYYFALLRDARDGHLNMGNSSFAAYRDAPSLTGYALLPQGLLGAFISLDLTTVVLLGDILFPACIAFLLYMIAFCVFRRRTEAALFAIVFLTRWGTGSLRTMNPQVTMSVFFLCLYLLLADPDTQRPWRRGLGLAAAVLVHPVSALLLLAIEGLDAAWAALRTRQVLSVVRARWKIFLPPLLAGLGQSLWVTAHTDSAILADLSARRGLILSHLPSDPVTSALLLLLSVPWLLRLRATGGRDSTAKYMVLFALGGLVVLNQQVLHGHEVIFGLYYHLPLTLFLTLMIFGIIAFVAPRWLLLSAFSVSILFAAPSFAAGLRVGAQVTTEASQSLRDSDVPAVLTALEKMSGDRIVLAPIDVSNLVPVLTHHTTLFTQYAHFEYVSDAELAERYLLIRKFFPLPAIQTVEGDPLVFGLAAGNLYARAKLVCRLRNFLGMSSSDCAGLKLPDFILHQDVRRFVDEGVVDAPALLAKYRVNTVVSDRPLPALLATRCRKSQDIGQYVIYDCAFGG